MADLFSYPMAAFARRVAEHPERFCWQYRLDAIKYTTAVLQSYVAFLQDLNFVDGDPRALDHRPRTLSRVQRRPHRSRGRARPDIAKWADGTCTN